MENIYYSKKDGWIVALLLLIIVSTMVVMVSVLYSGDPPLVIVLEELLLVGIVAFTGSLWRNTNYTLTDEELLVRAGPIRERIPLAAIKSVRPSRALWSSAALLLDRLHIRHNGSRLGTYISPADKQAFLRDLAERVPALTLEAGQITRRQ
ncbi:MAG: PH domain-containing protein [Candidatus Promineifilaceae bacterium]|nr:PH domain-containing protein [Candidatus Promineifilaceae bacterium]